MPHLVVYGGKYWAFFRYRPPQINGNRAGRYKLVTPLILAGLE